MFYEFSQNNSGGSFDVDDKVCHRLFIEADNLSEAIFKAEQLGCYWYGVASGIDCPCCGDRWSKPWDEEGETFPKDYSATDFSSLSSWHMKYDKYEIIKEPHLREGYMIKSYVGKIRFHNVEEYAQYLSDNYGWTTPDTRIYYKNGDVKEVYTDKNLQF